MTVKLVDDCFRQDPRDQERLSHDEVIAQLNGRIVPVVPYREVELNGACGLISADDVCAPRSVPGHTNSAVDGYAFGHTGLKDGEATTLSVVGRAAAGRPLSHPIRAGQAARIFTGAVLPDGCDCVAMQEDCLIDDSNGAVAGDTVTIPPGLKPGSNVRQAGEDVTSGEFILRKGDVVRPQDIAALASVGRAHLQCYRSPNLAVVSTGDEVIRVGTAELEPGQVFDTNAPLLMTLATSAGCHITDLGVLGDNHDDVVSSLRDAADKYDVILTTGGASQGDEDHMARAITYLGTRHFWQIAVKPGRPLMFGQIGNSIIIGLPGNPVAVFVCFLMYVRPLLRRLAGAHWPEPRRFAVPAAFTVRDRKIGRREFWRATTRLKAGRMVVEKYPKDGSGLISGLRAADGIIDVREDVRSVSPGDLVDFIPFSEFGIST